MDKKEDKKEDKKDLNDEKKDLFNRKSIRDILNSGLINSKMKYILMFMLGIIVTIGLFTFIGGAVGKKNMFDVEIKDEGISAAINKVYDATVYIENYKGDKLSVSGTGFVYKKDDDKGYILTNYHVVNGSTKLKVVLSNDKTVDAKYLGGDQYLDVAVISVDKDDILKVAKLGSSKKSVLGDTVFTVGSPVGDEYRGTVTRGILSGKDRLVTVSVNGGADDYVMKLLQTDAAMNPGNSGGPLCNHNGEVIGMNSLKLVKNEVEGMGFAIPIEDILAHIEAFEKDSKIKRPYLGIAMINLNNKAAMEHYGLDKIIDTKLKKGVVVESVQDDGSALGKLKRGDVIVKFNRVPIDDMAYFRYELFKHNVGDKITLTVERDGKLKDVSFVLKEKSGN